MVAPLEPPGLELIEQNENSSPRQGMASVRKYQSMVERPRITGPTDRQSGFTHIGSRVRFMWTPKCT